MIASQSPEVTRDKATHANPAVAVFELFTAISMTMARGAAARIAADIAGLSAADRLVDVGCGPGTAVRVAARRGASAVGVDPSRLMLTLARRMSRGRRTRNLSWLEGRAEELPLADASATVVWALSSLHHWEDRSAGLAEIRRVLRPDGRVILVERHVLPGARGHATHGLTDGDAHSVAGAMVATGFGDVRTVLCRAGRRPLVVLCATR
jgi:ubiquinone/menaquinone biosynthesis C-methylase UbiE